MNLLLSMAVLVAACLWLAIITGRLAHDARLGRGYVTRVVALLLVSTSVAPSAVDLVVNGRPLEQTSLLAGVLDPAVSAQYLAVARLTTVLLACASGALLAGLLRSDAVRLGAPELAFGAMGAVTLMIGLIYGIRPHIASVVFVLASLVLVLAVRTGYSGLNDVALSASVVSGLSLMMWIANPATALMGSDRLIRSEGRLAGIVVHPNGLGLYSAIAVACGLLVTSRYLRVLALSLGLPALYLSESRAAWVAAAFAIALILATGTHPRRSRGVTLIKGAVLGGVAMLGAVKLVVWLQTSSLDFSTLNGRTAIWEFVAARWHEHPAIGHGPMAWTIARSGGAVSLAAGQAHNQMLDTLYRYGLITIAIQVVLIGIWMLRSLRQLKMGAPAGLAFLVLVTIVGLAETDMDWGAYGGGTTAAITLLCFLVGIRVDTNKQRPPISDNALPRCEPAVLR